MTLATKDRSVAAVENTHDHPSPIIVRTAWGGVMGEHTPGPWFKHAHDNSVHPERDGWRTESAIAVIVSAGTRTDAEAYANALLIAAAPELLSVVRDMFNNPDARLMIGGNPAFVDALVARAHAVLAKATPQRATTSGES